MSFTEDATRIIRAAGGRMTEQRLLIVQLLAEQAGQIDADSLFELASTQESSIGRATVYRTLNTLADAGLLQRRYLSLDHERLYFELPSQESDYLLTCRVCHQTMAFQSDLLRKLKDELAKHHGFDDIRICVCADGICSSCQEQLKG